MVQKFIIQLTWVVVAEKMIREEKIAVDNNGNVYVTGTTRSSDFPTVNTLYSNLWGYEDAFVTKINSAGTSVLYSTYLGGSNQEWGMDIALDSYGNAYVTGTTFSDDFPTKKCTISKPFWRK